MNIDYAIIEAAFDGKAWAYAEQLDSVKIGKWDGKGFIFHKPLDEQLLIELRVFDKDRELKFTKDKKHRDTASYDSSAFVSKLADAKYVMYGENAEVDDGGNFTKLWEERGGILYFPAALDFPSKTNIELKLGIRNFVRYNKVPVLRKGDMKYDSGISMSGAGALEVVDYAYTGFYYSDNKAVEL